MQSNKKTTAEKDENQRNISSLFANILKRHPEFLFKEGTVTDHFGRKIKASPYRLEEALLELELDSSTYYTNLFHIGIKRYQTNSNISM